MTYLVGNENFGQIWILEVERNMWSGYKRAKKKVNDYGREWRCSQLKLHMNRSENTIVGSLLSPG
jgi:hypothetical protein